MPLRVDNIAIENVAEMDFDNCDYCSRIHSLSNMQTVGQAHLCNTCADDISECSHCGVLCIEANQIYRIDGIGDGIIDYSSGPVCNTCHEQISIYCSACGFTWERDERHITITVDGEPGGDGHSSFWTFPNR